MSDNPYCLDPNRRQFVMLHDTLNGIDYVEVLDSNVPSAYRQRTLLVKFLKDLPGSLSESHLVIEGGVRVKNIPIQWACKATEIPYRRDISPEEKAFFESFFLYRPDVGKTLVVRTKAAGDFSTYRLRLVGSDRVFDPLLSKIEFSFKSDCPSQFDCRQEKACPSEAGTEPPIDYLSKDYASFRNLMLDRLSLLMPEWKERSPADLGVALVELFAYAGDQLSYYQDAVATEAYLDTSRTRVSARRHALLLDYPINEGCNSRVWVCFNTNVPDYTSVGAINDVAITPTGRWAVIASADATLKVWDLEQRVVAHILQGHSAGVNAAALTSDGCLAVSASSDNTLKVWDLETGELKRTLSGHTAPVNEVAVAPNTRMAVSASSDNTLKVWDLETGVLIRTLSGHADGVNGVAISTYEEDVDIKYRAVSASSDKTLKVWDLQTGSVLGTLSGHAAAVNSVAVKPDGSLALSACADGTIKVWNLSNLSSITVVDTLDASKGGHTDSVNEVTYYRVVDGVQVSPRAASVSADRTIKIWDLSDLSSIHLLDTLDEARGGHSAGVNSVALTRSGNIAISGSSDCTARVWDLLNSRSFVLPYGNPEEFVLRKEDQALGRDTLLVTKCSDSAVLSPEQWEELKLKGAEVFELMHDVTVNSAHDQIFFRSWGDEEFCCLPKGATCASLREEFGKPLQLKAGDVLIFEELKGVGLSEPGEPDPSHRHAVRLTKVERESGGEMTIITHPGSDIAVFPDSNRAASASLDGTLKIWNINDGELLATLRGHTDGVNALAISADGELIVSASSDNTIKIWNAETGVVVKTLVGHEADVNDVAVSIDRTLIVSGSADGTVKVWNISNLSAVPLPKTLADHTASVNAVAVTADKSIIVSGSSDKTVKVWDLANISNGKFKCSNSTCSYVYDPAVGDTTQGVAPGTPFAEVPDSWVCPECGASKLEFHPVELLYTLEGHGMGINGVALTPDGRYAVSASSDCSLRVWDVETGQPAPGPDTEPVVMTGHTSSVNGVAVTPDGSRVLSASSDKTIKMWALYSGQLLATLASASVLVGGESYSHQESVNAVAVTPDGNQAVSVSSDRTIKVWDISVWKALATLRPNMGVQFDSEGGYLDCGNSDIFNMKYDDWAIEAWTMCGSDDRGNIIAKGTNGGFSVKIAPNGKVWVDLIGDDKHNAPCGIAADDDYVYIADTYNHRIVKRKADNLEFVSKIGYLRNVDDKFNNPSNLCVYGDYLYVADTNNHRISKLLASDLSYVNQIGSLGSGDDNFNYPSGIATDGTFLYIADTFNSRIIKRLASDLSYVSQIGSFGSSCDKFGNPAGIATDGTYLYIADTFNNRIVKRLASNLSYVNQIGSYGSGDDQFYRPYDISYYDNHIYIVDTYNHRIIKRLASDLSYVSKAGGFGFDNNTFYFPYSCAARGLNLYIADRSNHRVIKRAISDLSYVRKIGSYGSFGDDNLYNPYGIASDGTYIYIADTYNHRIIKRSANDFSYISQIGSLGSGDDQFNMPRGIATDGAFLYIADSSNHRIMKRNCSDLSYVSRIGNWGTGNDQFKNPYGIAIDSTYVYVADSLNHRLVKRNKSDLTFVTKIGSRGTGDDQFNIPRGVSSNGTYLYVADLENARIFKRNASDLSYISKIGSYGFGEDYFKKPNDITVSGSYVYVIDSEAFMDKRLASDLSYVARIGPLYGNADISFSVPCGISSDENYIFIADTYNNRIMKRSPDDLSLIQEFASIHATASSIAPINDYELNPLPHHVKIECTHDHPNVILNVYVDGFLEATEIDDTYSYLLNADNLLIGGGPNNLNGVLQRLVVIKASTLIADWDFSVPPSQSESGDYFFPNLARTDGVGDAWVNGYVDPFYTESFYPDVNALDISSSGDIAVAACSDNSIRVFDLVNYRLLKNLQGHTGPVNAVLLYAVLVGGQYRSRAVSASADGTLIVWDLDTGQIATAPDSSPLILEGHAGSVNGVAIYPILVGGVYKYRIVSASSDQTLKVWDQETGELLMTLAGHTAAVNDVAVYPILDGTQVKYRAVSASDGPDNNIKTWDLDTGQVILTLTGHTDSVEALNIFATGEIGRGLISASADETLKVWDLWTGNVLMTLIGHTGAVNGVDVYTYPDGAALRHKVVSASSDRTLKVWDMESGQLLKTLVGHKDSVNGVVLTPDGSRAVSASSDSTLKIWNLDLWSLVSAIEDNPEITLDARTVHVEWHQEDAIPFPLCVSARFKGQLVSDMSCALGNVALADYGRRYQDEPLIPEEIPEASRYRPHLQRRGISFSTEYDHEKYRALSASFAIVQDPLQAVPCAMELYDEDGKLWLPRRTLLKSSRFDTEFAVETEDDGTAYLLFGDDVSGKKPSGKFLASYRLGNGRAGNVGAESIVHIIPAGSGSYADLLKSIRNPLPARGGTDPEPTSHVRLYAPHAFRTQQRAVTRSDYEEMAKLHPEVQQAVATLRWTGSWYTMFITVDRENGREVDREFKDELLSYLEKFRLAGHDIEIEAPHFVALDIAFRITVASNYLASDVKTALLEIFSNSDLPDGRRGFFHPNNFTFAQPLYLSKLVALAMQVPGVEQAEVERFRRWDGSSDGVEEGAMKFGKLEILRLDNDPSLPENGRIDFIMEGGI